MNIELFNKQLASKVAKATNLEKRGDLKEAINAWLEVSDMSLKFSKTRGIDSSFRNMLIKRTENIVDHIKSLKSNLAEPEAFQEDHIDFNEEFERQELNEDAEITDDIQNQKKDINNTIEILKDIPGGFVEIKASKDFDIITPHEELDIDIFKDNKTVTLTDEENLKTEKKEGAKRDQDKGLICFACGFDNNPPNAKTCKNCNVDLK